MTCWPLHTKHPVIGLAHLYVVCFFRKAQNLSMPELAVQVCTLYQIKEMLLRARIDIRVACRGTASIGL